MTAPMSLVGPWRLVRRRRDLWSLVVLTFFFPALALAQVRVDSIPGHRPAENGHGVLDLPVVSTPDPQVAYAINTQLQISELGKIAVGADDNPFDRKLPASPNGDGFISKTFQIHAVTRSFLSLEIDYQYLGDSRPHDGAVFYNFDLHTGARFILQEIFTQEGLAAFSMGREKDFSDALKRVLLEPKQTTPGTSAAVVRNDDVLHLLAKCSKTLPDDIAYLVSGPGFWLTPDALHLDYGVSMSRCAPTRAEQAVVEKAGLMHADVPWAGFERLLNAYGHCLLIDQRDDCVNLRPYRYQHVLRGTIGVYPVGLLISGGSMYFYEKNGTLLPLENNVFPEDGAWNPGAIIKFQAWSDRAGKRYVSEVFNLKIQADGSLAGTWHQIDSGKTQPVTLH